MELSYVDLEDGIRKIDLNGRMDLEGANAIDLKFTTLTATQKHFVIVDLSGVEFMATLGIATLVRNAKAARLRSGNLVLLNPRPNVASVLATTRIDKIVNVCWNLDEALAQVRAVPESKP
jgi:anti-sigma B factor antagonist